MSKKIELTIPLVSPAATRATEEELRRKRISFSVLHDNTKRQSTYIVTGTFSERALPTPMRRALGVR